MTFVIVKWLFLWNAIPVRFIWKRQHLRYDRNEATDTMKTKEQMYWSYAECTLG